MVLSVFRTSLVVGVFAISCSMIFAGKLTLKCLHSITVLLVGVSPCQLDKCFLSKTTIRVLLAPYSVPAAAFLKLYLFILCAG